MENFQWYNKDILTILNTLCTTSGVIGGTKVTVPCIRKQEQVENDVQEHQRVAYEHVESASALATDRTGAQVTSRSRDTENNVEANFSHQKRGSLIEITSESAQALEAQRHSVLQEATAEMMRRDTRNLEVVSQLRSELQKYHLHAEGQSDGFQQTEADLRHMLETSNTEGV